MPSLTQCLITCIFQILEAGLKLDYKIQFVVGHIKNPISNSILYYSLYFLKTGGWSLIRYKI